jgi:hypothetical protein
MMALSFCSSGRITSVVGGPKYEKVGDDAVEVGYYEGLWTNNLSTTPSHIIVKNMEVVKRSRKVIAKYGKRSQIRDDFVIPVKRGLYDNPYWDQFVPFGWLVLEYLVRYIGAKNRRLFPYERQRAWQIVNEVTGMFPNWFRAQAEHWYGHHIMADSVKLAAFVKVVRPEQIGHYIGYDWREQLKAKELSVNFQWIDPEIAKIRSRIASSSPKILENLQIL